ncbi:MAG: zf-HC2 domain-containing protein [Planctomycetia bacterium]|nr:MAG: zf-HC2 domain-containing protein [Planctomycetia bacterium]
MNCQTARESLGAYLDGELPSPVRLAVSAHLSGCPICTAELESLRGVATALANPPVVPVPERLWGEIERKLDHAAEKSPARSIPFATSRRFAIAASVFLALGLGAVWILWTGEVASTAKASTLDFGALLDSISVDPTAAFDKFLDQYQARHVSSAEAKRTASQLNFEIPEMLPGGFRLEKAYTLRFGDEPGAAARYTKNGEFLGAIFHRPVQREHFGTHKDYGCVIGQHRGHAVAVGDWKLVHLTDATTCHCVLSKLDEKSELPLVLSKIAPDSLSQPLSEEHPHDHEP